MHSFIIGDIVIYKKDDLKQLYVINKINDQRCIISGLNYRIIREVDVIQIEKASSEFIEKVSNDNKKYRNKIIDSLERGNNNFVLGKILHLDGDEKYLNKCLELYKELGVYSYGVCLDEEEMYKKILSYMYEVNPDIVVVTGHDFFEGQDKKTLDNYKNTNNFIKVIKEIRKVNQTCCIIAGACQSNFEALIANGADFASSPGRINIHVFDPAVIAVMVASTSFRQLVSVEGVYKYIENGRKAFGCVQTLGKMKIIL